MILSVNIDHIATLRQARLGVYPDPVMAATLAIMGGADGITLHLREDRRHVQDRDLDVLREVIATDLNLEMAATGEMIGIALKKKPDMVTLVPEKRQELTTEGGLDVKGQLDRLKDAVKELKAGGIPVSLFINPSEADVKTSKETGADMVEIHTGAYAEAVGTERERELEKIKRAIKQAVDIGLVPNAGHGLNNQNLLPLAAIKEIHGFYIGHGIVSRAVFIGMERAVREMKDILERF